LGLVEWAPALTHLSPGNVIPAKAEALAAPPLRRPLLPFPGTAAAPTRAAAAGAAAACRPTRARPPHARSCCPSPPPAYRRSWRTPTTPPRPPRRTPRCWAAASCRPCTPRPRWRPPRPRPTPRPLRRSRRWRRAATACPHQRCCRSARAAATTPLASAPAPPLRLAWWTARRCCTRWRGWRTRTRPLLLLPRRRRRLTS
jgi:hypothetical protein